LRALMRMMDPSWVYPAHGDGPAKARIGKSG
jgi:hypothetical protein